jgi:antirestriction protein
MTATMIALKLTNAEWLRTLSDELVSYVTDLVNNEGYPLDDIRDFVEKYGEKYLLDGSYETWSKLSEYHPNEAIEAFVENNNIGDIDQFEDAYMGEYSSVKDFTMRWIEDRFPQIFDHPIVVDYDATWNANLRSDYNYVDGFVFLRHF